MEWKEDDSPNIVAKYSIEEGRKLRIVLKVMGTTEAIYYKITKEGLEDEKGKILYSSRKIEAAREKYFCNETKSYLTKLAANKNFDFRWWNRHNFKENGGPYWSSTTNTGLMIIVTGVPKQYFLATAMHKHCPDYYIYDSRNGGLQGPISEKTAKQTILTASKKAGHEIKLAREKAKRDAQLEREKRENEARLAREKREHEAKLAHEKRERSRAFLKVSRKGDLKNLKLLLEKGVDADKKNRVFIEAARKGDTETLKLLIDYGVDINTRDISKSTALYNAVSSAHIDTVKYLLYKGADTNIIGYMRQTPLSRAKNAEKRSLERVQYRKRFNKSSPLYKEEKVKYEQYKEIIELLKEAGAKE